MAIRRKGTRAAVVAIDVDRDALASLDTLTFVRGDFDAEDFWSFVVHCRGGAANHARPLRRSHFLRRGHRPGGLVLAATAAHPGCRSGELSYACRATRSELEHEVGVVDIEPLKAAYWGIVTDCLMKFHGIPGPIADAMVVDLRDLVESPRFHDAPPAGYDSDLFFHGEPFHVACDLAGRDLDLNQFRSEYESLLTGRYSAAETLWLRRGEPDREQYAVGSKR